MIEFDFMKGSRRTKVSQVCWRTCCRNSVTWLLFLLTKCFFFNLKFLALCSNLVHNTDSYPIMTVLTFYFRSQCLCKLSTVSVQKLFPHYFLLKNSINLTSFYLFFFHDVFGSFFSKLEHPVFLECSVVIVLYICLQSLPIVKSYINQHNMYKP